MEDRTDNLPLQAELEEGGGAGEEGDAPAGATPDAGAGAEEHAQPAAGDAEKPAGPAPPEKPEDDNDTTW